MPGAILFVPCDGSAVVLPGTRRELNNQHVQYSRHVDTQAKRHDAAALPRQIRYRAFTEARHTLPRTARKQRKAKGEAISRCLDPWALNLPLYRWTTRAEGDLYNYYATVVAAQLFSDKRGRFWEIHVLQACHELAVVRDSLLSLSAAFPHIHHASHQEQNSTYVPYTTGAHASCAKAVSMLRAYMQHEPNPSHGIVLTCAIILHAQAKLVRNAEAAMSHLETAITISNDWAASRDQSTFSHEFTILRTTLSLLDLEATLEIKTRPPRMTRVGPFSTRFESVEDMMYEQSMVCREMMTFAMTNYAQIVAGPEHCPQNILDDKFLLDRKSQDCKVAVDDFLLRKFRTHDPNESSFFSPRDEEAYASTMLQYFTSLSASISRYSVRPRLRAGKPTAKKSCKILLWRPGTSIETQQDSA